MKLLSRDQIETLSRFKSEPHFTTSFYLDTDKSRRSQKEIHLIQKNLLNKGKAQLGALNIAKEAKESLAQDLEKINLFCSRNMRSYKYPGLAVFSCSRKDFWQVFYLPIPPRNRIVFDRNPYVRSLSAVLDDYHHACAFLIDRRDAEWHDIFTGEISLLESLSSDVPSRVREGGWEGYEEKRIERHIEAHLHEHFKTAARRTFELFNKHSFEWLFLGSRDDSYPDVESLLHPYVKSRLKGRLKTSPGDSPDKILKEAAELAGKLKKEEEDGVVQRLVTELEKGALAVSGIKDTLRSLNGSGVQTLVVTRGFSKPGQICSHCRLLFLDELQCPSCQRKTDPVVDIIDEAVEAAMDTSSQVKHVNSPSQLDRFGKIGAFLRFR